MFLVGCGGVVTPEPDEPIDPELQLIGIEIDPQTMDLFAGQTKAITSVTAHYSDGSTAIIALKDCVYESSHKEFVTVTNTGLVTAVAPFSATITVSYTEKGVTKTDKMIVTVVLVVNHFPTITSIPGDTAIVGVEYIYEVKATDPDGDVLTYSLINKPEGMTIDFATISWIPTEEQIGVGNFTVKVSDGQLSDTQSFGIIVSGELPPVNQSPIASFTATPASGVAPLEVYFNASNSYDSDGTIISYTWNFKDGNIGSGETINHTFSSTGSYNVELTVIDNEGAIDSTTKIITVTYDTEADFDVCENILIAFYAALSNQNYAQALSYCKLGGATYDYVNALWDLALEYPQFYMTYQIYSAYNFSYIGQSVISFYYDYSYTSHDIWGGIYDTKYEYGSLILFEKVYGVWKMS